MKKIETEQEAWALIGQLQKLIGNGFKFIIHPTDQEVYLYGDGKSSIMKLKKVSVWGIFPYYTYDETLCLSGKTVVEAVQQLVDFFESDGKAKVATWGNHQSFSARLSLKNEVFILERENHTRTTDSDGAP